MQKIKLVPKSSKALRVIKRNAPGIALIGGGVGFCGAVVTSSIAAVKSVRLIDAEEQRLGRKLTLKEKVKLCGKNYLPTMLLVCASGTSLAFSGVRYKYDLKQAGLLYTASETARKNLENAITKKYGEKKLTDIRDDAARQYVAEHPVLPGEYILDTGLGNKLCYDSLTGRKFLCSEEGIKHGINEANAKLHDYEELSFDGFWECVSEKFGETVIGKHIGWRYEDRKTGKAVTIKLYVSYMNDPDGGSEPVLVIGYSTPPEWGFDSRYPLSDVRVE